MEAKDVVIGRWYGYWHNGIRYDVRVEKIDEHGIMVYVNGSFYVGWIGIDQLVEA